MPRHPAYQIVFIGSTGGGVLSRLGKHAFVRDMTIEAVSDRECGFLSVAETFGIPRVKIEAKDGRSFSDALYNRYLGKDNIFYISFYTKLFRGAFVTENRGRIFNCHPSLLPSFKGMKGFEDTIESGCRFMGCTLHLVDEGMDTGTSIIQAAIPINRALTLAENRHKVFLSQYYSTIQVLRWIYDGRLVISSSGEFAITGEEFAPSVFSPNLDADLFEFIGEKNLLC